MTGSMPVAQHLRRHPGTPLIEKVLTHLGVVPQLPRKAPARVSGRYHTG